MSSSAARLGEVVGAKYRVVRFLAAGGMGVVYEAQHTVVGRRFAIKFLRPELAQKRESLARFQREAQAAGALESEHVTAVVDFGIVADGSPYLVMEYLVGENLEALLAREGPLPLERASELVVQASRGMQVAHAAGIVHRDLKPQNLFLCRREDGTDLVKVLDFGVAKLDAFDEGNGATRTGTVLGTPAYMSPEQARGEKTIDQRTDVYGLGAILYELVSGRKPHPGASHNAVLHHISTQPAVPIEAVTSGLPAEFVDVVRRALAASADERHASAERLAEELARFARRTVWPAAPREASSPRASEQPSSTLLAPERIEPALAARAPSPPVASSEPGPGPSAMRRLRRPLVLALAAGVLVLAEFWLSARRAPEAAPVVVREPPVDTPLVTAEPKRAAAPVVESPAPADPPAPTLPVASVKTQSSVGEPSVVGRSPGRPAGRPPQPPRGAAGRGAGGVSPAESGSVTFDPHNPYN